MVVVLQPILWEGCEAGTGQLQPLWEQQASLDKKEKVVLRTTVSPGSNLHTSTSDSFVSFFVHLYVHRVWRHRT